MSPASRQNKVSRTERYCSDVSGWLPSIVRRILTAISCSMGKYGGYTSKLAITNLVGRWHVRRDIHYAVVIRSYPKPINVDGISHVQELCCTRSRIKKQKERTGKSWGKLCSPRFDWQLAEGEDSGRRESRVELFAPRPLRILTRTVSHQGQCRNPVHRIPSRPLPLPDPETGLREHAGKRGA